MSDNPMFVPCRDVAHRGQELHLSRRGKGLRMLTPPADALYLDLASVEQLWRYLRDLAAELHAEANR
ncbi:hypothetical protein MOQ72_33300 [Saccharopolyspora sp. K220]|uniref:hypothetical protein n=1 Tax=Saccharopolyspora soli TaxID=2926618 RepID=UPI001F5AE9E5|nr:hypothetical protein [Saccharopolyspora soli]MCI2422316.1 hypothetical protein [Saccharopolyspora soli]